MLTPDKTRLKIFSLGITIDETLPKHVRAKEAAKAILDAKGAVLTTSTPFMDTEIIPIARGENFETFRNLDPHGINVYLRENEYDHLISGGRFRLNTIPNSPNQIIVPQTRTEIVKSSAKLNWLQRLFGKKKTETKTIEVEDGYEIDVVSFFSEVKKLTKLNKDAYRDRVEGYIKAIKMADAAGQEALKEKLLQELVINKYESVLYATGNYYAITEDQAVEFANKAEKGVELTYVKNFIHPIPVEIIEKIREMNELEIFDNYVVMHYDPDKTAAKDTHGDEYEREREKEKQKDPIVFGIISGSDKLYYVADWIYEYCDLTLQKFAEVLQNEGGKEALRLPENIKV